MEKQIAVIRLRGRTGLRKDIAATLEYLNIGRVNSCTILPDTEQAKGMLRKAKDYITWGEIDDETLKLLLEKRGETPTGKKALTLNGKQYKPCFRLSPAKGGLGSRGIKASFVNHGALGNRKEKINELLKRMM